MPKKTKGSEVDMTIEMTTAGQRYAVQKVGGSEKTRDYLQTLGFFSGAVLTVISASHGKWILSVKDGRYAIDDNLASVLQVVPCGKEGKP